VALIFVIVTLCLQWRHRFKYPSSLIVLWVTSSFFANLAWLTVRRCTSYRLFCIQ
jgi:hypothetical protein